MKKLLKKVETSSLVKSLSLVALVLGALITIGGFVQKSYIYTKENFFAPDIISETINGLYAGQSIEYFRQHLGAPILERIVSKNYKEFVFNYKGSYIQALVTNRDNEVIYWAITYCSQRPLLVQRPIFEMAREYKGENIEGNEVDDTVLDPKLLLNKTTFKEFFKDEESDSLVVFVSGATANSFAYESIYLANPGAYQTVIVGINDVCSRDALDEYSEASTLYKVPPQKDVIERLRKNVAVNTYAETAPFRGEEVLSLLGNIMHSENDSYLNFGVDRIKVRYFSY